MAVQQEQIAGPAMLVWHWMWDDCASAILQMRMKCGSCSFHMMIASWHLHLKTEQLSFWEVSRLSAAFF